MGTLIETGIRSIVRTHFKSFQTIFIATHPDQNVLQHVLIIQSTKPPLLEIDCSSTALESLVFKKAWIHVGYFIIAFFLL